MDANDPADVEVEAPHPLIDDGEDVLDEDVVPDRGIFDLPDNVVAPRVQCTFCSFSCTMSAGLVRHVLAKHEGAILNTATCSCFVGIGKGLCLSCGTLRVANGNFCGRCRTSTGTRPPIVGDVVRAPKSERNVLVPESIPDDLAV